MGIKNLNKLLRDKCKNSIKMISITELSGKKIVVDISIYLYKYSSENALIENIYSMLSIFNYYQIIPLFIFDGKAPPEKKELLIKRIKEKKHAEKEYYCLKENLTNNNLCIEEKKEIISSMDILKKQFLYLKKEEIIKVKELICSYGASYLDAPGEADELCAMLVIKNKVWACLSEDSDMFVYGCPRVLRYFSLLNHTVVLYDMKSILFELELNQHIFREICILSGTDYDLQVNKTKKNNIYLDKLLELYKQFLASFSESSDSELYSLSYTDSDSDSTEKNDFYKWLDKNEKCIDYNYDYESMKKIYSIFDLSKNNSSLSIFENISIVNGNKCNEKIREILKEDGFIFPE